MRKKCKGKSEDESDTDSESDTDGKERNWRSAAMVDHRP